MKEEPDYDHNEFSRALESALASEEINRLRARAHRCEPPDEPAAAACLILPWMVGPELCDAFNAMLASTVHYAALAESADPGDAESAETDEELERRLVREGRVGGVIQ